MNGRCVQYDDQLLNFKPNDEELLQSARIQYGNIHPMLDYSLSSVCSTGSVERYKAALVRYVSRLEFDYHFMNWTRWTHCVTFFPRSGLLKDSKNLVAMTTNESSV